MVWKFSRHLERNHNKETEVKLALDYPKKSLERRNLLSALMRKGDYESNINALKNHSTDLIVVRSSKIGTSLDGVPCPHCFGFMQPQYIHKHVKACHLAGKEKASKVPLKTSRFLLCTSLTDGRFRDVHTKIMNKMNRDELHLLIRNDNTLLLYAAVELQKKEKCRYHDIRYSLRCLARLLIQFRKGSGNEGARAEDLVLSNNFDYVVDAAKFLTGYKGPRKIDVPNTFCKYGYCLRNLALIVRAVSLKENDNTKTEKCRNFLELYETDWTILANNAKDTYEAKKANEPEELPLEDDVKAFRTFCLKEIGR